MGINKSKTNVKAVKATFTFEINFANFKKLEIGNFETDSRMFVTVEVSTLGINSDIFFILSSITSFIFSVISLIGETNSEIFLAILFDSSQYSIVPKGFKKSKQI